MTGPTLDWRALSVTFGSRSRRTTAVDRVTRAVEPGDVLALIGPNGSGKTTAIRATLGLVPIAAGDARVFGERLAAGSAAFRDVVYVPEEPYYHDYLTIEEALRYYARLRGRVLSQAETTAVLERLHLSAARHTRLAACSKGMKQKLGLSQCLLGTPRLLVLDEPMRGLDPVAVREVRDIITQAHAAGAAVLLCSHVLSEVEHLATRVAVLDSGRLLAVDAIGDLLTFDTGTYEIEVTGLADVPDLWTATSVDADVRCGTVRAGDLHVFLDWCRVRGAVVRSCRLRRRSLEDSLMDTLASGARADA
jgi:Cu-processing system ATP-binding protein